jgi:hypothetical protein
MRLQSKVSPVAQECHVIVLLVGLLDLFDHRRPGAVGDLHGYLFVQRRAEDRGSQRPGDMHHPIFGIVLGIAQPNAKATIWLIVVADEDEIPTPTTLLPRSAKIPLDPSVS